MKTLFLTGGGGAIGSAIKDLFLARGWKVIAPTSRELDLSDLDAVRTYMQPYLDGFDALIFSAGRNNPAELGKLTVEEIKKTIDINCVSVALICSLCRAAFEKRRNGRILGISSLYGNISREGRAAYAMSKHALNSLISTLALELGPSGILCNTLSPGFVKTKMTLKNNTAETLSALERKIPLGRFASVQDIARIAYFLCSEENTYISGQDIIVDGGFMAGGFQHL